MKKTYFWKPARLENVQKSPDLYEQVQLKNGRTAYRLRAGVVKNKTMRGGGSKRSYPEKRAKRRSKEELLEAIKQNPKLADKFKSVADEVAKLREQGLLASVEPKTRAGKIRKAVVESKEKKEEEVQELPYKEELQEESIQEESIHEDPGKEEVPEVLEEERGDPNKEPGFVHEKSIKEFANTLTNLLKTSTNKKTRYDLDTMLFEVNNGILQLTTTDGKRITRYKEPYNGGDSSFVLDSKELKDFLKKNKKSSEKFSFDSFKRASTEEGQKDFKRFPPVDKVILPLLDSIDKKNDISFSKKEIDVVLKELNDFENKFDKGALDRKAIVKEVASEVTAKTREYASAYKALQKKEKDALEDLEYYKEKRDIAKEIGTTADESTKRKLQKKYNLVVKKELRTKNAIREKFLQKHDKLQKELEDLYNQKGLDFSLYSARNIDDRYTNTYERKIEEQLNADLKYQAETISMQVDKDGVYLKRAYGEKKKLSLPVGLSVETKEAKFNKKYLKDALSIFKGSAGKINLVGKNSALYLSTSNMEHITLPIKINPA